MLERRAELAGEVEELRARLAAGETPSPEMVAGAGKDGGLRPWVATLLLVSTLVSVAVAFVLVVQLRLTERLPKIKPPPALIVGSNLPLPKSSP